MRILKHANTGLMESVCDHSFSLISRSQEPGSSQKCCHKVRAVLSRTGRRQTTWINVIMWDGETVQLVLHI